MTPVGKEALDALYEILEAAGIDTAPLRQEYYILEQHIDEHITRAYDEGYSFGAADAADAAYDAGYQAGTSGW